MSFPILFVLDKWTQIIHKHTSPTGQMDTNYWTNGHNSFPLNLARLYISLKSVGLH